MTDFAPGWAGCTRPGHPNFHSHDCAATEAAIQALPPELRPVEAHWVSDADVTFPDDKTPTGGLTFWDF